MGVQKSAFIDVFDLIDFVFIPASLEFGREKGYLDGAGS